MTDLITGDLRRNSTVFLLLDIALVEIVTGVLKEKVKFISPN